MNRGAIIDPTGCYRYLLWREWESNASRITFIILNPSRADAEVNEPTIRRCLNFDRGWGYGSLLVVNLFADRTCDLRVLQQVSDPIEVENNHYFRLPDRAGKSHHSSLGKPRKFSRWTSLVKSAIASQKWLCSSKKAKAINK